MQGGDKFVVSVRICVELRFSVFPAESLFLLLLLHFDWGRASTSVDIWHSSWCSGSSWENRLSTTLDFHLGMIIFQYLSHNLFKYPFSPKQKWGRLLVCLKKVIWYKWTSYYKYWNITQMNNMILLAQQTNKTSWTYYWLPADLTFPSPHRSSLGVPKVVPSRKLPG